MSAKLPTTALLSVAWPYANGHLHLGHVAGNFMPAEIKNQYLRMRGVDVIMVSGTDMHGTPVAVKAWEKGMEPKDYALSQHQLHLNALDKLGYNFSLYTATNTDLHQQIVQLIFKALVEMEYLTKQESELYWSEKEHKYLLDRYIEGTCPNCGAAGARGDQCDNCGKQLTPDELIEPYSVFGDKNLEKRKSTNYYLRLDKLQPKLEEFYENHADFPDWRKHVQAATEAWLKEGLEPRAITRDMEGYGVHLPAGYEVEGEDGKVLYVWFEAVLGYFTAPFELMARLKQESGASAELETFADLFGHTFAINDLSNSLEDTSFHPIAGQSENWEDFWVEREGLKSYFYMGKDNITFHSIILPAMLLGVNEYLAEKGIEKRINLPDFIPANQFLNLRGGKFSKSKGNIINPVTFQDEYTQTTMRYFLISRMPENKDYDFTWAEFVEANNNELLANLGNFINRALVFWNKYFAAEEINWQDYDIEANVLQETETAYEKIGELLATDHYSEAMRELLEYGSFANKYFNDSEIWAVRKDDPVAAERFIKQFLYIAANLANLARPMLPEFAENILDYLQMEVAAYKVGQDLWQPITPILDELDEIADLEPLIRKLDPIEVEGD